MASERENVLSGLNAVDYDVAGNRFRAYFDAGHDLIFVLDETINDIKPNVLLVLDPVDGRKWDDVLANDYGVDLETVRPKKDNKYQKLDIEYAGLDVYAGLVGCADNDSDVADAVRHLNEFRYMVARRVAADRLAAADVAAHNARDTIAKTHETIAELQVRIKQLRSKLVQHKKEIGKEPTKQSAAKILRREAQIDLTNEKLTRAKKRLTSAQRRLVAAEDDARIARGILDRVDVASVTDVAAADKDQIAPRQISAPPQFTEISFSDAPAVDLPAMVSDDTYSQPDNILENAEPKAEIMADEEVKPLFDKDPEILDEEIAFKPIEFNIPSAAAAPAPRAVMPQSDVYDDVPAPSPLAFTPPIPAEREVTNDVISDATHPTPVLETITSVVAPGVVDTVVEAQPVQPAAEYVSPRPENRYDDYAQPAPVAGPAPRPVPMPDVSPAPAGSELRPVSPIVGRSGNNNAGVSQKKPTLLYYIMLVALIALSIFTLWVYQKSSGDNVPDLASSIKAEQVADPAPVVAPQEQAQDNPFIDAAPVVSDATPEKTVSADVASAPVPADPAATPAQPEPVAVVVDESDLIADVVPDPVPVVTPAPVADFEPEPVVVSTPFLTPEPVAAEPAKVIPTDEEILATKPGYSVSQPDNMFVADAEYETEVVMDADTPVVQAVPVVTEPVVPDTAQSVTNDAAECSNGGAPDNFGCCPGEVYTNTDGGFACCAGDECFPPMF